MPFPVSLDSTKTNAYFGPESALELTVRRCKTVHILSVKVICLFVLLQAVSLQET